MGLWAYKICLEKITLFTQPANKIAKIIGIFATLKVYKQWLKKITTRF